MGEKNVLCKAEAGQPNTPPTTSAGHSGAAPDQGSSMHALLPPTGCVRRYNELLPSTTDIESALLATVANIDNILALVWTLSCLL